MSVSATQWAWRQALKPVAKLVLLALADRANANDECWPSIPRLVVDVGADRKTVLAAIKQLEAESLIRVARSSGNGNRYRLLVGQLGQQTDTGNGTSAEIGTSTENGTPPVPETGLPSTANGTGTSTKNGTLNLKEESNNNLSKNLKEKRDTSSPKNEEAKLASEELFRVVGAGRKLTNRTG